MRPGEAGRVCDETRSTRRSRVLRPPSDMLWLRCGVASRVTHHRFTATGGGRSSYGCLVHCHFVPCAPERFSQPSRWFAGVPHRPRDVVCVVSRLRGLPIADGALLCWRAGRLGSLCRQGDRWHPAHAVVVARLRLDPVSRCHGNVFPLGPKRPGGRRPVPVALLVATSRGPYCAGGRPCNSPLLFYCASTVDCPTGGCKRTTDTTRPDKRRGQSDRGHRCQ